MAKKITQNVIRQLVQLGGEIPPEVKKQPEKIIGVVVGQEETKPPKTVVIEQLKQGKAIQTRQQIAQLEQEIRCLVGERRRQQEEWRRAQEEKMVKGEKEETKEPTSVVPSKPKRRLFGFWGRRVKTAQQQS